MTDPSPDTWRADPTKTFYVGLATGLAVMLVVFAGALVLLLSPAMCQ